MSRKYSLIHRLYESTSRSLVKLLLESKSLTASDLGAGGPTAHMLAQFVIDKKIADYCQMVSGGGGPDVVMYKGDQHIGNIECKEGGSNAWTELTAKFRKVFEAAGFFIEDPIVPTWDALHADSSGTKMTADQKQTFVKEVLNFERSVDDSPIGRIPAFINPAFNFWEESGKTTVENAKKLYNNKAMIQKVVDWVDSPTHAQDCSNLRDALNPDGSKMSYIKVYKRNNRQKIIEIDPQSIENGGEHASYYSSQLGKWKLILLGPGYGDLQGELRIIPAEAKQTLLDTIGTEGKQQYFRKRSGSKSKGRPVTYPEIWVHMDRYNKEVNKFGFAGEKSVAPVTIDSFTRKGDSVERVGRALVKAPTKKQLEDKWDEPHPLAGQKKYRMSRIHFPANATDPAALFNKTVHEYMNSADDNYFFWNPDGTASGGAIKGMANPLSIPEVFFSPIGYDSKMELKDDKGLVTHKGGFTLAQDRGTGSSGIRENVPLALSEGKSDLTLNSLNTDGYSSSQQGIEFGHPSTSEEKTLSGAPITIYRYTNPGHRKLEKRFQNYW